MANQTIDAISSAEQLLMFDENHDDLLLLDDFVNDMVQEPSGIGQYGTQFPGFNLEENIYNENGNFTDFTQNPTFVNSVPISIWPVPPSPYSCTCCQSLREFFHINGNNVLKLDIHGRLGLISHAVLERYNTDMPTQNREYHMFDFCQESISNVKQFLVQYCEDRKREGYTMLQDPLSNFYNALCIGLDGYGNLDSNIFHHQTPRGDEQTNKRNGLNQQQEAGNGVRAAKSYVASQRERTGKMKVKDLAGYFHVPIADAAKELNICPSAVKSICRKEGLSRWPHRKIKSIHNNISKKKQSLNSNNTNERARALAEIQELERELADIYQLKKTS